MKLKPDKLRNPFALIAVLLGLFSFLFPWWSITLIGEGAISVYPYNIHMGVHPPEFTIGSTTSRLLIFTSALIISFILLAIGSTQKGRKGRLMIGLGGLMELGIAYGFRRRIYERVNEVASHGVGMFRVPSELPVSGTANIFGAQVETGFGLGFYLIILAGIVALFSLILHGKYTKNLK